MLGASEQTEVQLVLDNGSAKSSLFVLLSQPLLQWFILMRVSTEIHIGQHCPLDICIYCMTSKYIAIPGQKCRKMCLRSFKLPLHYLFQWEMSHFVYILVD